MRKTAMRRLIRDEKGYVLILALLLLALVGLISAPVLSYMVSGLRAGQVFETKAAELYAADAGVEDALSRIRNGEVKLDQCHSTYGPYPLPDVNDKSVEVTITLVSNTSGRVYNITSTATRGGNSSTKIESFLKFTPGSELRIFGGALASQTTIELKKNSDVHGDVYYCNGTLSKRDILGNWTYQGCEPFPSQLENVNFANTFKALAMNGTIYPNGLTIDRAMTLGPAYIVGDLYVSKEVTVTLAGVVYATGSIKAGKEFTLSGSGSIVAENGDIDLYQITGFGTSGDSLIMALNGDIKFWKYSTVTALIYAPNGEIYFDKGSTVIGGVVGQSIYANKEGSFTYVAKTSWDFPGGLPGSYVLQTYDILQGP